MAWPGRGASGATNGYGRFIAGNAIDAAVQLGRWDEAEEFVDELLAGRRRRA